MMEDVLGAVNDFILTYCKTDTLPALEQNQIVRGWQNLASALPANSREYVILTLLSMERHGTNAHIYKETSSGGLVQTIARLGEHMVQVDFCCSYPDQNEEVARTRADLLEMLSRDALAVDFYKAYGFSILYADGIRPLPFLDPETKQWIARYTVTIHLEGWTKYPLPVQSSDRVGLYIENVDVHHPVHQ